MELTLEINLGYAINKNIEPEVWNELASVQLGLWHVQFVADLLNPLLTDDKIDRQIDPTNNYIALYGVSIDSVFTSAFTRVNHLLHPDPVARLIWLHWFECLLSIGSRLCAKSAGSHFGIVTFSWYENESVCKNLIEDAIRSWQSLLHTARDLRYEYLVLELMSVSHEMANTVEETLKLMDIVNQCSSIKMQLSLDIGHVLHEGQRDPNLWIEKIGTYAPIIHLQQTEMHMSCHWSFTEESNRIGIIELAVGKPSFISKFSTVNTGIMNTGSYLTTHSLSNTGCPSLMQ